MAWLTGWNYRVPITVNASFLTQAATNVRLYVRLNLLSLPNLGDGAIDIRFTSSNGTTLLPFERDWILFPPGASTVSASFWVKIASVPVGTSTIYMYWDNTSAADASDGNTVWRGDYAAVFHIKDNGDADDGVLTGWTNANGWYSLVPPSARSLRSSLGSHTLRTYALGDGTNDPNSWGIAYNFARGDSMALGTLPVGPALCRNITDDRTGIYIGNNLNPAESLWGNDGGDMVIEIMGRNLSSMTYGGNCFEISGGGGDPNGNLLHEFTLIDSGGSETTYTGDDDYGMELRSYVVYANRIANGVASSRTGEYVRLIFNGQVTETSISNLTLKNADPLNDTQCYMYPPATGMGVIDAAEIHEIRIGTVARPQEAIQLEHFSILGMDRQHRQIVTFGAIENDGGVVILDASPLSDDRSVECSTLEPTVTLTRAPAITVDTLSLAASVLTPTAGPIRSNIVSAPTLTVTASVIAPTISGQQDLQLTVDATVAWCDVLTPTLTVVNTHTVSYSASTLSMTSSLPTPVTDQDEIAAAMGSDDAEVYHRLS